MHTFSHRLTATCTLLFLFPLYSQALHFYSSATVNGSSNNQDIATDVTRDSYGNIYATGFVTQSTGRDIWVAKYDPNLTLISSATFNGSSSNGSDDGSGIAVDTDGSVYVTGGCNGNSDIWVGKYSPFPILQSSAVISLQASTMYGEWGNGIAIDSNHNVYVTGLAQPSGRSNLWIGKFNSSLALQASSTFNGGGIGRQGGQRIAVGAGNNIYVVGYSSTTKNFDILLAKYDSSLVLLTTTTVNGLGNGHDYGYGIALDTSGNVYAAGAISSTAGGTELWLGKFDSSLSPIASTSLHSSNNKFDRAKALTLDSNGNIYVTGSYWLGLTIGEALWVGKFSPGLVLQSSTTIVGPSMSSDEGKGIVTDTSGNVYVAGYIAISYGAAMDIWLSKHSADVLPEPVTAPTLSGTAITPTSIRWSWTDPGSQTGFSLIDVNDTNIFGNLSSTMFSWDETSLSTNTLYTRSIVAFNSQSSSTSALTGVFTSAAPPAQTRSLNVYKTSATIQWDTNTNPPHTVAELQRSSDNTSFTTIFFSTGNNYTDAVLLSGVTYYYRARNINGDGVATNFDQTVQIITATTEPDVLATGKVRAVIKVPKEGKRIAGNWVTVVAELTLGTLLGTKHVFFQYLASGTTQWLKIPAANINHPNPDAIPPYFIHWDVTQLSNGDYQIRAVAYDMDNRPDSGPPVTTITVDSVNHNLNETNLGSGRIEKRETVNNSVATTIQIDDEVSKTVSSVSIPAGAINTSTTTVTITNNPLTAPPVEKSLTPTGIVVEIILSNGQSRLSESQTATITFTYPDENNDGIVDGTQVEADKLRILTYDTVTGKWRQEFASTVDTKSHTVTGNTPHFSLFTLAVPATNSVSDILVYPVPWVPNDESADNGKPFNAQDLSSGIVFDNLPQSVKIQIYSVTGELIWELTADTSNGIIQWNGLNNSGNEVSSGGYFAIVTDIATGSKAKRKIAIIR